MSYLSIVHDAPGEWDVWIQLEKGDPTREVNSMCIGEGTTRDEALASAVAHLEGLTATLQERPDSLRVYRPRG